MRHSQDPPLPWLEVAARLDRDESSCRITYKRAVENMECEGKLEPYPHNTIVKEPEKCAEFINAVTDPQASEVVIAAIAKRLNLPENLASALARDIRSIYFPTSIEVRNVKLERLKDLWGMRAEEALAQLTPERMNGATPRDLAIIAGIATEKLLLLRGLPTQIVKNESDRVKIGDLAQAFIEEAERRGHEIQLTAESREVSLSCRQRGPKEQPIEVIQIEAGDD